MNEIIRQRTGCNTNILIEFLRSTQNRNMNTCKVWHRKSSQFLPASPLSSCSAAVWQTTHAVKQHERSQSSHSSPSIPYFSLAPDLISHTGVFLLLLSDITWTEPWRCEGSSMRWDTRHSRPSPPPRRCCRWRRGRSSKPDHSKLSQTLFLK